MTIRAIENAPEFNNGNTGNVVRSIKKEVEKLGLELRYDDNLGDLEFMSNLSRLVVVFPQEQRVLGGMVKRRRFTRVANVYLGLNKVQLPAERNKFFDDIKAVKLALLFVKQNLEVEYI